jgi:hypothetical protein
MNLSVDDVVRPKRTADSTVLLLKVLWSLPTFQ